MLSRHLLVHVAFAVTSSFLHIVSCNFTCRSCFSPIISSPLVYDRILKRYPASDTIHTCPHTLIVPPPPFLLFLFLFHLFSSSFFWSVVLYSSPLKPRLFASAKDRTLYFSAIQSSKINCNPLTA